MKRSGILFFSMAALLLLTGCGINVLNTQGVRVGVDPAPLGYEVDDDGAISITSHQLVLNSRKGAMGATVQGYRAYFFDEFGDPVKAHDSTTYSEGSLNVYVPAGIRCDNPDEELGCTVNSAGVRYAEGPTVLSQPVFLMPGGVALAMEQAATFEVDEEGNIVGFDYPVGWHVELELYGEDDNGRDFVTDRFRMDLQVPLGG